MANVMDRLLLYHLDKEEREDAPALKEIQQALAEASADIAVDFIGREDLERWRELQVQIVTRPPSFALFASKPGELPDAYRRYLTNALRQDFDLPGTPIRLMLRKSENPYAPG